MTITTSLILASLIGQQEPTRHNMRVSVNGEDVTFVTAQPFVKQGFTLVPIRGIFEKIGAKVDYDSKTSTVMAYKPGIEIVLKIGSTKALVNNKEVYVPLAAQIVSGSTMVPLRFLSESLGATVSWDEAAYWVNIYVPQHEDDLKPGTPPPGN
ncbi:MAG: copper amine oxidase N-terminal domain-containing protein [Fimbriimonadaceae bacterium]